MSVKRDKMITALREHVVPVLRERGFKGSFPHFRRLSGRFIHILSFQFSSWGGGFVVEAAACPDTGITLLDGRHFPPTKVAAHHTAPRIRLGSSAQHTDHWFYYDERAQHYGDDVFDCTALAVVPHLEQAESWWKHYASGKISPA